MLPNTKNTGLSKNVATASGVATANTGGVANTNTGVAMKGGGDGIVVHF